MELLSARTTRCWRRAPPCPPTPTATSWTCCLPPSGGLACLREGRMQVSRVFRLDCCGCCQERADSRAIHGMQTCQSGKCSGSVELHKPSLAGLQLHPHISLSDGNNHYCRDEVAGCSERAYPSLKVEDAQRLLLMQNSQDTCRYAAEVRASKHSELGLLPCLPATAHLKNVPLIELADS